MTWKPDYATLSELKAFLRITDTVDDTQIATVVTAASRAIDKATGRQFGLLSAAAEWIYTPVWDRHLGRWIVTIDDVATTTAMIVKIDGTATTDYTLEPRNAVAKGRVWTQLVLGSDEACTGARDCAAITASWGWPSVPVAVKEAALLQASRFHARRDSPYGVAGSPAEGSELRLLATVDPDVRVALGDYTRVWGMV